VSEPPEPRPAPVGTPGARGDSGREAAPSPPGGDAAADPRGFYTAGYSLEDRAEAERQAAQDEPES
jgi:hypothetical protein